jgi:hypothetical protein
MMTPSRNGGRFPCGVARLLTSLRLGWPKPFGYPSSDPEYHGSKNKNQNRNANRLFNQSHQILDMILICSIIDITMQTRASDKFRIEIERTRDAIIVYRIRYPQSGSDYPDAAETASKINSHRQCRQNSSIHAMTIAALPTIV